MYKEGTSLLELGGYCGLWLLRDRCRCQPVKEKEVGAEGTRREVVRIQEILRVPGR